MTWKDINPVERSYLLYLAAIVKHEKIQNQTAMLVHYPFIGLRGGYAYISYNNRTGQYSKDKIEWIDEERNIYKNHTVIIPSEEIQ